MIVDLEENKITLSDRPNGHQLVIGNSGQGKTFYCCRRIEEDLRAGKKVFIVDYSGSYRENELEKSDFKEKKALRIFKPAQNPIYFSLRMKSEEYFVNAIVSALVQTLKIRSHGQKSALTEAVKASVARFKEVNFAKLYEMLEEMLVLNQDEGSDRKDAIDRLLSRFENLSDVSNLHIRMEKMKKMDKVPGTILQLSDFPMIQREILTEFFVNILWQEVFARQTEKRFDTILLDEFQHMSLAKGGALSSFLREGRKFGISVILSTQFVGKRDVEEQETFLQAGNILIFKPVIKEIKFWAEVISFENAEVWKLILRKLHVGEAVLFGHYRVNENIQIQDKPLICQIR